MSDSDESVDNALLARILKRRSERKSEKPARITRQKKRRTEMPRIYGEPKNERETEPVEVSVVNTTEKSEEEQTFDTPEEPKEEPKEEPEESPEPAPAPVQEEEEKDEAQRLEQAHAESKRIKRRQMRGEVKPSSKVERIIRRKPKKKQEAETSEYNPIMDEMRRLREEVSQLRELQIRNQQRIEPASPELTDGQSKLLMGLMGRRF